MARNRGKYFVTHCNWTCTNPSATEILPLFLTVSRPIRDLRCKVNIFIWFSILFINSKKKFWPYKRGNPPTICLLYGTGVLHLQKGYNLNWQQWVLCQQRTTTRDMLVAKQMAGKAAQCGILLLVFFQEMEPSFPNDYQPLNQCWDREMSQTPSWEELKQFIFLPTAKQLSTCSFQDTIMVLLHWFGFCCNIQIQLVWQFAMCCVVNKTCNRMAMIIFKTCIFNQIQMAFHRDKTRLPLWSQGFYPYYQRKSQPKKPHQAKTN